MRKKNSIIYLSLVQIFLSKVLIYTTMIARNGD